MYHLCCCQSAAHLAGGQRPDLQLLHLPRILIQPLRPLGQVCVFSFLKGSGFCGNMHNMEVKGIKNGQKFQFILMGFHLKLMSSKLFLVSATFCPLFFPLPALWTSHSHHQMQKQQPYRGLLNSSCCCKRSNTWNRPIDIQVHIPVCSDPFL